MAGALQERMRARGGRFDPGGFTATHFGDPAGELRAALETCALVDRADHARWLATGPDLLDLLQRLSTGDLRGMQPGDGRPTVLTTAKGRIVERLFVHRLDPPAVLLLGGPGSADRVAEHLRRHTFAERTELRDATAELAHFALVGPRAAEALERAGGARPQRWAGAALVGEPQGWHVLGHDGISAEGVSWVGPASGAAATWERLREAVVECGGLAAGDAAAESWRVLRGHPQSGRELTVEYNPLEAGLGEAVSFAKGCYVGQEVVARLNTYDKVSRRLAGLRLPAEAAAPPRGTRLLLDGREVGVVTSAVHPPGRPGAVALAYVKRRETGAGAVLDVGVGGAAPRAELVELPFDPGPERPA